MGCVSRVLACSGLMGSLISARRPSSVSPISDWVPYDHTGSCKVAPTDRTVTSGVLSGCWGLEQPATAMAPAAAAPHQRHASDPRRATMLSSRGCVYPSVLYPGVCPVTPGSVQRAAFAPLVPGHGPVAVLVQLQWRAAGVADLEDITRLREIEEPPRVLPIDIQAAVRGVGVALRPHGAVELMYVDAVDADPHGVVDDLAVSQP